MESAPRARIGPSLLLVGLYAFLLYLPFLGSGRTLTAHEGMVTQPALRMLDDGQWIVPHYASGFWLDKPPLMSWITAGIFAVSGGFSEFGARLPAALSAIGISLLVTFLAGRFFDRTTAMLAGLAQASSVYLMQQGRLGEIDIPLTLLIAGAHAALAWHWGRGQTKLPLSAALLFHTLAGLAVLAKGPVALAFFGMSILWFCAARRSLRPLIAVLWTPAILSFLVLTVSWHVGAVLVAGDEAWRQWNDNYLKRFSGEHHLGREPFWFYFVEIPWLMLPWTIALAIGAFVWLRRPRFPQPAPPLTTVTAPDALDDPRWFNRFLWCWFLGGLLFLSLSAFKHKHYCYPILPPLSIFCAQVLRLHIVRVPKHAPRFYFAIFAGIALVFTIVNVFYMPYRDPRRETVDFVQQQTEALPPDARILVVGLAQHAAYPYIARPCLYADTLPDVKKILAEHAGKPLWVLTLRQFVQPAIEAGITFDEIAAESARKRVKEPETLVLLRPR